MTEYTAQAEYHDLESVRVHSPGFETFAGIIDPEPNLFRSNFSIEAAQEEHQRVVNTLREEGVEVHYLEEDIANGNQFESLLNDIKIEFENIKESRQDDISNQIRSQLQALADREKLQLVGCQTTIVRHGETINGDSDTNFSGIQGDRVDKSSLRFAEPLSNLYFQRDPQIVTAKGPVLASPAFSTREGEVDIARAAWKGISGSIVCNVPADLQIEGGDYIPCDDFGLLGIAPPEGNENKQLRTSLEAAEYLLDHDAFGHDVVGLVEAPYEVDEQTHRENGKDVESAMEIMHLDTWFNVAADGIAVAREKLVNDTTIHVYKTNDNGYTKDREMNFGEFLRVKDYTIIPVEYDERAIATNFLTLADGKVLAACFADEDGDPDIDRNKTIERMKDAGIEVIPNGKGLPISELRSGYGGIHCMTTPLNRLP